MLTIEEKIRQLEAIAESGDELYADYEEHGLQDTHGARRAKSLIEEKRQEIAWLRELVERRKAPEIIRCKDCAYCGWDCVDAPYGMTKMICWCDLHYDAGNENLVVNPDDYCKWAKRRTDK